MDLKTLWENFDVIAEAENGIQQLKELILDLAFQGQLTSNITSNENAEQLIKSVVEENKQVYKPVESAPYALPKNWTWAYFQDFLDIQGGSQPPKSKFSNEPKEGFIRLLQIRDFGDDPIPVYIPKEEARKICDDTDVMLARYGASIGKVFMGKKGAYNVAITKIIFDKNRFFNRYIYFLLKSSIFQNKLKPVSRSAQAGFNKRNLYHIVLPVAPLNIQHHVVKKIDELMGLCDRAQASKENRNELQQQLRQSAIHALETAETEEEFNKSWHFVRDNFSAIVSSPNDIQCLRKLILTLGVRGKFRLLNNNNSINNQDNTYFEKEIDLKNNRKRKKNNIKPLPLPDKLPFRLPKNWKWERFINVTSIESNLVEPQNYYDYPHIAPNYIERDTGKLLSYKTIAEDKVTSNKHRFYPGQIIYSKIRPNLNKAVFVDFEGLCSADMYPLSTMLYPRYFICYILSDVFLKQITSDDNRLAMPKVNQSQLSQVLIAVPPLKEQKRIVAKVDELMKICDRVEENLSKKEELANAISASVIHHIELGSN